MKPVTATFTAPQPRDEESDLLDMLGNHERFTDRFRVEWEFTTRSIAGRSSAKSLRRLAHALNNRSKEEAR